MTWYRAQMHGIGSLPSFYLRREVKWRFASDDVSYTKLSTWPVAGTLQGAVSSLHLSSALLWCHLQKTQTCFQPQPKLFCCFMVRAGHHDSTLKWNKSSGKFLVWNCREITGSRARDAYCRGKNLCVVLVHCKREGSCLFFGTTHNLQKVTALRGVSRPSALLTQHQ